MGIAGAVEVDIRNNLEPYSMRAVVDGACSGTPDGVRLILHVGALAPEPEVVYVLRRHRKRLNIEILGTPYAYPSWREAVEDGLLGEQPAL